MSTEQLAPTPSGDPAANIEVKRQQEKSVPAVTKPRAFGRWRWIAGGCLAVIVLVVAIPWVLQILGTVSTDDAYVNGHVTFVAPRVAGQVEKVLVDDNNRVHKGDLLVQLDR